MALQRRQLYLLYVTLFQVMLGFGVVIPILPFFARQLGASAFQMGLLITLWAGAQFLFSPVWGGLSDRLGRRPVLLVGLCGYCLTFAALALSTRLWMLFVARFLGGMLTAATIPAAQAYLADVMPPERRSAGMASVGAAMNLGFIAGPAFGGLLATLGVQAALWVGASLALVNAAATFFLLPESLPAAKRAAARAAGGRGRTGPQAVWFALRSPYAGLFLLAFVATFGGSAMFSMLAYYLMDRVNGTEAMTGLAFTVEGLTASLVQLFVMAPLIRRLGEETTVRLSLVVGMVGFGLLVVAPNYGVVLIAMAFIAAALASLRPTIAALLSVRTQLEQGITMGIQNAFDALGRTVGPLWAGFTFRFGAEVPFIFASAAYGVSLLLTVLGARRQARRAAHAATRAAAAPLGMAGAEASPHPDHD